MVRAIVAEKLQEQWSPQQIAGWLRITFDGDETMQISHETIYKSLFNQARGVLKKELRAHLRSRQIMRRGNTTSTAGQTRGQIIDVVSIRDMPAANSHLKFAGGLQALGHDLCNTGPARFYAAILNGVFLSSFCISSDVLSHFNQSFNRFLIRSLGMYKWIGSSSLIAVRQIT